MFRLILSMLVGATIGAALANPEKTKQIMNMKMEMLKKYHEKCKEMCKKEGTCCSGKSCC